MKHISSINNPLVKNIIELKSKSSVRKEKKQCIIEGQKEIEVALASDISISSIFYLEHTLDKISQVISTNIELISCTENVMSKMAMRDSNTSMIALANTSYLTLDDIANQDVSFVLILENIEKPGNLGALFRTCDAAGVEVILCTEMQTDLYNPNVIRNSLGCVFSQQIIYCTNEEARDYCLKNNIQLVTTYLHTSTYYYELEMTQSTAIVMGSEGFGVTDFWLKEPSHVVKIPMKGKIDSMNVSNSASIMLYEVVRQRL